MDLGWSDRDFNSRLKRGCPRETPLFEWHFWRWGAPRHFSFGVQSDWQIPFTSNIFDSNASLAIAVFFWSRQEWLPEPQLCGLLPGGGGGIMACCYCSQVHAKWSTNFECIIRLFCHYYQIEWFFKKASCHLKHKVFCCCLVSCWFYFFVSLGTLGHYAISESILDVCSFFLLCPPTPCIVFALGLGTSVLSAWTWTDCASLQILL